MQYVLHPVLFLVCVVLQFHYHDNIPWWVWGWCMANMLYYDSKDNRYERIAARICESFDGWAAKSPYPWEKK